MSFTNPGRNIKVPNFRAGGIAGVIAVLLGLFIFAYLIFGTRVSTAPDQAAVWYKGGVIQSKKFDHCVQPSTKQLFGGFMDKTDKYPAGQRTYKYDEGQDADIKPIVSLSDDNIELTMRGVIRFTLDTSCENLQKFHESIGIKFGAKMDGDETSEGWRNMLLTYLQPSLQRAMNEATAEVTWKDLYDKNAVRANWEKRVGELLPRYVEQAMDGDYFQNYQVTAQKPDLPPGLVKALNDTQVAVEQNNAQAKRNTQIKTELESVRDLVKVLGPNGYNLYQALKDDKITFMPVPSGSGLVVNPSTGPNLK